MHPRQPKRAHAAPLDSPSAMAWSRAAIQSATSVVPMCPGNDWMLSSPKPVDPLRADQNVSERVDVDWLWTTGSTPRSLLGSPLQPIVYLVGRLDEKVGLDASAPTSPLNRGPDHHSS